MFKKINEIFCSAILDIMLIIKVTHLFLSGFFSLANNRSRLLLLTCFVS